MSASPATTSISISTSNANGHPVGPAKEEEEFISSNLSTSALETKLRQLREQSNQLNQELTQKLASSQSGQNLLHIGSSLSTLPPDLHSLLTQLHPLLSASEQFEKLSLQDLSKLTDAATEIRTQQQRSLHAAECADLVADLAAAEHKVKSSRYAFDNMTAVNAAKQGGNQAFLQSFLHEERQQSHEDEDDDGDEEDLGGDRINEDLDHASSLERAAHITLCLVEDLQSATATVTSLTKMMPSSTKNSNNTDGSNSNNNNANNNSNSSNHLPSMRTPLAQDSERAQFVLKLAPRIRRLESDTIISLGQRMERILKDLQHYRQEHQNQQGAATTNDNADATNDNGNNNSTAAAVSTTAAADGTASQEDLLLMLGHCMRGLALLGRGKEVESIFARVAIMPLIRSKVSMGRLDEGGSRGECAGLFSLLDDMAFSVHAAFGPVLSLAESMFDVGGVRMDVDLLTCGVWVPIATALMADAGIKMAIFSPGIASILQANYTALDVFLSELSARLLTSESTPQSLPPLSDMNGANNSNNNHGSDLYFRPSISKERIQQAQDRIYSHPKTAEFSKKWNLPIYYQLRFGECCTRLNQAVDKTQREGWVGDVFSRSSEEADSLKQKYGFELSLFLELYDVLLGLWRPDVILRPLTNRFLRGSVQLIGRVVAFIDEGMDGKTKFGEEPQILNGTAGNGTEADGSQQPAYPTRTTYCWGDSEIDVAAVAWELTILESNVRHDYVNTVCDAFCNADSSESEREELRSLISETLKDASDQIHPLIDKAWNEYIVNILTTKCAGPLAGVRGVAATYRMTNRPPPTQASPFVGSILRPLKEFDQEFSNRTPDRVGSRWKQQIVVAIADRYAAAVEELIATVQRTEAALQSRRTRRTSAGGMSDGEKVKLQLYLDCLTFSQSVLEVGVDPATVIGLSKLRDLTAEGEQLRQNGK